MGLAFMYHEAPVAPYSITMFWYKRPLFSYGNYTQKYYLEFKKKKHDLHIKKAEMVVSKQGPLQPRFHP